VSSWTGTPWTELEFSSRGPRRIAFLSNDDGTRTSPDPALSENAGSCACDFAGFLLPVRRRETSAAAKSRNRLVIFPLNPLRPDNSARGLEPSRGRVVHR
jgi:hypothetical protein